MAQKWKDEWGSALELAEDLWRLRLRHPSPANHLIVNTYVHRGGGELVVIDPGWAETIERLETALRTMGLADSLADVDYWLYTHSHIDHMGGAALLQEHSQAPHVAWRGLEPHLADWHAFQDDMHDWLPWIGEAFAEPHRSRLLAERVNHGRLSDRYGTKALERVELVDFGDTISVGDLSLDFVDARGHDPHHGAFFDRERGWLFSGDVVIAVPTPISRAMDDRLDLYRASLARLEALDSSLLLPGHGLHRRDNMDVAFERSRGFVDEYAARTAEALADVDAPVDLYELSLAMTPDGEPYRPSSRWWVHMALVDSHVRALVEAGEAEVVEGPRYALSPE